MQLSDMQLIGYKLGPCDSISDSLFVTGLLHYYQASLESADDYLQEALANDPNHAFSVKLQTRVSAIEKSKKKGKIRKNT